MMRKKLNKYDMFQKVIIASVDPALAEYNNRPGVIHEYDEIFNPEYQVTYQVYIKNKGYVFVKESELKAITEEVDEKFFHGPKFFYREIVNIKKPGPCYNKKGVVEAIGASDDGALFGYNVIILDENFYENQNRYDKNAAIDFEEIFLSKTGSFLSKEEYKKLQPAYSGVTIKVNLKGYVTEIVEGEDRLTPEEKEAILSFKEDASK